MSDKFKLIIEFNISYFYTSTKSKISVSAIVYGSPHFATKRDTLYDTIKLLS